MESETSSFVVARVDRRGQLPPTYLRKMVFNSLHSARAIQPISSSGAQKPRILQGGFADASRK
jgi:hypothetical protein